MTRYTRWQSIALALTIANLSGLARASAQEAGATSVEPSGSVADIVVTAQKRTESTRTIPISISALGGADLARKQIAGFEDLTRNVPGVSFGAGGAGFGAGPGLDNIEIRGISASSGSAVVGVYLDETPITVPNRYDGMTEPRAFDLERVEILRGPQGTLYGASSMGGTIRFITNKPNLDKFEIIASGDVSRTKDGGVNHNESGVVNIPLVPGRLAIRAGVEYGRDSGWIDNYNYNPSDTFEGPLLGTTPTTLNKKNVNSDTHLIGKFALEFKPSDSLTITPSVWYQRTSAADSPIFYPEDGLYKQTKTVHEFSRDRITVTSLDIKDDMGFATLSSISSFFQRNFQRQFDGTLYNSSEFTTLFLDPSPLTSPAQVLQNNAIIAHIPSPEIFPTRYTQYSQEFRLSSRTPTSGDLPLRWTIGFFYSNQTRNHDDTASVPGLGSAFQSVYGYPIGSPSGIDLFGAIGVPVASDTFDGDTLYNQVTREREREYAGFGQIDYDILPRLHVSVGLRYVSGTTTYQAVSTGFFAAGAPTVVTDHRRDHAFTPKASLSFDVTRNTMVYGTVSKGFRLGGAAGPTPSGEGNICSADFANLGISGAPKEFGSDKLWSYEAGVKSRLAGGSVEVNAAGYLIDWTHIQQKILLPLCGYSFITNIGDAKSYGLEGDLKWNPRFVRGLSLEVTGTAGKSYITKSAFPGIAADGEHIPYTPSWTATFTANYERPLSGRLFAFVQADYDFIGKSHGTYVRNGDPSACATDENCISPNYIDPEYSVLNVSLGVRSADYEISIYAKNLLDDKTIIQRPVVAALVTGLTVRPLTAGLRMTKHF